MIPSNKINNEEKNEEPISYLAEILPDYQKRSKATISNIQVVQNNITTDINVNNISAKSRMRKYFEEFANNSSIHGFNHLVAPNRHPLERFLAGMFILGGFACFIYVSVISWYRYQYDGFIVLVDQQKELIRLVKPSVLICPTDLIDESKFPATFERYDIEDTPKNRQFFYFLSNIKYDMVGHVPDYQSAPPELWLRILNDLKKEFYYETSLSGRGMWIIIEDGICFSIGNHIHPYASIEHLLANKWPVSKLPTYPPDVSSYQIVNREIDDPNYVPSYVYYQNQNITEFVKLDIDAKVELIDPMELYKVKGPPHLTHAYEQLHSTVEVQLLLTTQAMDDVFNNKNRKKCRFPFDEKLDIWPIYTFQLCAAEYRARRVKKYCGCHPHFFPRMLGVPICNVTQMRCVKASVVFSGKALMPGSNNPCLLNCNLIHFYQKIMKSQNNVSGNSTNMEIRIIFPQYKHSMKERFSFIDFMITVGSAAGFFLGCSVLSGVEIFYYATLHLYTSKHKYKQN